MTVLFKNKGVLDPRAFTTFGLSTKSTDQIGFFGTGLKYAIAIILRAGGSIVIHSGGTTFDFTAKREEMRGVFADRVYVNDTPLHFTTDLGKTWEMWQAYRELYCNTIDEGGTVSNGVGYEPGTTVQCDDGVVVVVECEEFDDVHANADTVVLRRAQLAVTDRATIHAGDSSVLFYRGIRAYETSKPSLYTYNILSKQTLTEDRTFRWDWEALHAIAVAVAAIDNREIIHNVVTAEEAAFESGLNFSGVSVGAVFLDVVSTLAAELCPLLNQSAVRLCRTSMLERLTARSTALTPHQQGMLTRARDICTKLGHDVNKYPINIVDHIGAHGVLGAAHTGQIFIARETFTRGMQCLVGTLFEEYLHLSTGLRDETRAMQNFLIELYVSVAVQNVGEIV